MITHKLLAQSLFNSEFVSELVTEARKLLDDYEILKAEYSELKKENLRLQKQLEFLSVESLDE